MRRSFLALLCCLLLTSCIEYRWKHAEYERYVSTIPISKRELDPKLSSKARLWVIPTGDPRLYLGGDIRDAQLITGTIGVITYPAERCSFEIGLRTILYRDDRFKKYEDEDKIDLWEDTGRMFYIGGVILF